jgi:hypothetical protein
MSGGPATTPGLSLGSIAFQRDASIAPVVATIARDQDAKLEVVDSQGSRWTLLVPAGSVPSGTQVSIVPLTHLSSTDLPAPPVGGVLLEPDGLVLLRPATLSVTYPGPAKPTLLLTGKHDGTGMSFTLPAEGSPGSAALLGHFSSGADITQETPEQKRATIAAALIQREALLKTIRPLLKQDIGTLPTPPTLELECNDEIVELVNQDLIDRFIRRAGEPELDLARQWVAVNHALRESGREEWVDIALQLNSRLVRKAELLLKTYRGQRDKALAITQFYLEVTRSYQMLGGDGGPGAPELARLGDWLAELLEPMFKGLIEKHDYRQVTPILEIGRRVQLLGTEVQTKWQQQLLEKLFAALTFRLETQYRLYLPKQEWLVESTIPINAGVGGRLILTGEGTGKTVSYSGAASVPMTATPFKVTAVVDDFDACAGTATIRILLGAGESENYIIDEQKLQAVLPIVANSWRAMFDDRAGDHGHYAFPCQLRNLDATAVEETINGTTPHGKVSGDLLLRLVHVPRRSGAPR